MSDEELFDAHEKVMKGKTVKFSGIKIGYMLTELIELRNLRSAVKIRLHFVGHPKEPMTPNGPDWSRIIELLEKAQTAAEYSEAAK